MAREKVKGFDADSFIESVRESAVPTYHTAKAKQTNVTDVSKRENIPKSASVPDGSSSEATNTTDNVFYEPPGEDFESKYSYLNMTENEIEFIKTFIVNHDFRQVNKNGKQILIRKEHCKLILSILSLLDEDANMATYIDNVLIEHFKKYYPTIVGFSKKCPSKF